MKHKLINAVIKENYVKNLLTERGIANVEGFLNPTIEDIQNPWDLENMHEGVELLHSILECDAPRILLIIDSDNDGFASSAIIYQYIHDIKPEIEINYLIHEKKAHGLEDHIEKIENGEEVYDLIIIPDAGSNDKQYTDRLNCPILILDHHLVDTEIGSNVVLINNQSSPKYLNKDLSGGGVTWQFCRAFDESTGLSFASKYADLAAMSIISDMMGLQEIENQAIIKIGLDSMQNKFFQTLCEKQEFSMGGKVNPTTVAFYIVPLINSMVRVGTMEEKERMFLAFVDPDRIVPCHKRGAKGTTEKVCIESARECTNTKSKQDREKEKMTDKLIGRIMENGLLDNKVLFIELDDSDDFPSELNGLVCMQLSSKFQRPTMVARRNDEGYLRGSCRGLNESELTSFKQFLDDSGLFEYTAGHDNAFGQSIHESHFDKFMEYANKELANINFSEGSYEVNFERHALDGDLKDLIMEIGRYEWLWGQKMAEPLIYVDTINLKAGEWRVMGQRKDTVSFEKNGIKYIQFHASKLIEELESHPDEVQIEVVGRASINEWMGNESPQIMVKNYEIIDGRFAF